MPKIVISYRRSDSKEITGHIYERLCRRFGKRSVFMDIDNIPAGVDFRKHVDKALRNADVLLAIVGPGWLNVQPTGHTTLHNDWVGVEVGTGLKQKGLHIIPVLVRGAQMPAAHALPPALQEFVYLNAVKVESGQDFDLFMRRLIRAIDKRPAWLRSAIAACVALLLISAGGFAIWQFTPRVAPTILEPVSSKGPLESIAPVLKRPATTEVPRTESAAVQAPSTVPSSPMPVAPPQLPSPAPSATAPDVVQAHPPPAPATPAPTVQPVPAAPGPKKELASLPKQPSASPAPTSTTRLITAIEGESFVLCGQPDFTISMFQPGPNAPTAVSLRRYGMMMADGLSLRLSPGKPRPVLDGCEVAFIEVKPGFKPVAVLEERRKQN